MGKETDQPVVPPGDDRPHVLVVDDDRVIRKLARTLLESTGFTVSEAADGAGALEYLEAGQLCDLVLLDINMPGLNGDEVLRRLRANTATAGLPVVILSGANGGELGTELLDQCTDVISKPIDPPRFVAYIKTVLQS